MPKQQSTARRAKEAKDIRFQLPREFKRHGGGECPVEPGSYVEPIIRTAEGYGSAGVCQARMHQWAHDKHDDEGGLGAVVGYRLGQRGEQPRFGPMERF